jgi:hypothetical protein
MTSKNRRTVLGQIDPQHATFTEVITPGPGHYENGLSAQLASRVTMGHIDPEHQEIAQFVYPGPCDYNNQQTTSK